MGKDLDARSDLYSVGVVLYELFTGVRPIEGKTSMDVMRAHITIEPQRPTLLSPDLPDRLERIIPVVSGQEPRPASPDRQ